MPVRSALLVAILMLAGCASAPQAPQSGIFAGEPPERIELPDPVLMPDRPDARIAEIGDQQHMCFGSAEAVQLRERDNAGQANTEILERTLASARALEQSNRLLYQQAQALEQIANLRSQQWADSEARRLEDRREHRIETWMHRLLTIVLAGVAL